MFAVRSWSPVVIGLVMIGSVSSLGAVGGCSKTQKPRDPGATTIAEIKNGNPNETDVPVSTPFTALCEKVPRKFAGTPKDTLGEYSVLLKTLSSLNPELTTRFQQAHIRTLAWLLLTSEPGQKSQLQTLLLNHGKKEEWEFVTQNYKKYIHADRAGWATELNVVIKRVLGLREDTPCSHAFLNAFYGHFVEEVDPFGSLVPTAGVLLAGDEDTQSELVTPAPSRLSTRTDFTIKDDVAVVTFRNWDPDKASDGSREILNRIEELADNQSLKTLLFDLRDAGGRDLNILAAMRNSAVGVRESSGAPAAEGAHWGDLPITIWVNNATHGTADIFAAEFVGRPNAKIIGADPQTYGYARKICSQSLSLDPSLPASTVSVGCTLVQPYPDAPRTDAYVIKPTLLETGTTTDEVAALQAALSSAKEQYAGMNGGRNP